MFLNRLQCSLLDVDLLRGVSLVDTPGILAGEKQGGRQFSHRYKKITKAMALLAP